MIITSLINQLASNPIIIIWLVQSVFAHFAHCIWRRIILCEIQCAKTVLHTMQNNKKQWVMENVITRDQFVSRGKKRVARRMAFSKGL